MDDYPPPPALLHGVPLTISNVPKALFPLRDYFDWIVEIIVNADEYGKASRIFLKLVMPFVDCFVRGNRDIDFNSFSKVGKHIPTTEEGGIRQGVFGQGCKSPLLASRTILHVLFVDVVEHDCPVHMVRIFIQASPDGEMFTNKLYNFYLTRGVYTAEDVSEEAVANINGFFLALGIMKDGNPAIIKLGGAKFKMPFVDSTWINTEQKPITSGYYAMRTKIGRPVPDLRVDGNDWLYTNMEGHPNTSFRRSLCRTFVEPLNLQLFLEDDVPLPVLSFEKELRSTVLMSQLGKYIPDPVSRKEFEDDADFTVIIEFKGTFQQTVRLELRCRSAMISALMRAIYDSTVSMNNYCGMKIMVQNKHLMAPPIGLFPSDIKPHNHQLGWQLIKFINITAIPNDLNEIYLDEIICHDKNMLTPACLQAIKHYLLPNPTSGRLLKMLQMGFTMAIPRHGQQWAIQQLTDFHILQQIFVDAKNPELVKTFRKDKSLLSQLEERAHRAVKNGTLAVILREELLTKKATATLDAADATPKKIKFNQTLKPTPKKLATTLKRKQKRKQPTDKNSKPTDKNSKPTAKISKPIPKPTANIPKPTVKKAASAERKTQSKRKAFTDNSEQLTTTDGKGRLQEQDDQPNKRRRPNEMTRLRAENDELRRENKLLVAENVVLKAQNVGLNTDLKQFRTKMMADFRQIQRMRTDITNWIETEEMQEGEAAEPAKGEVPETEDEMEAHVAEIDVDDDMSEVFVF